MPAVRTTDGASNQTPSGNDAWDAAFADAREVGDSLPPEALETLGGETPQPSGGESSAGALPGSPDPAPPAEPTGDDGAAPASAQVATPATPETDPLAGAEPFTYTVDGKPETFEGAYRLPGDGVYVPEDKVPAFQLAMSQAKTLDRQVRDLHEKNQTWERLTAWTDKDAQGNDRTLTGREAIEAQRVNVATTGAVLQAILQALTPEKFAELVDVVGDETSGYQIIRNERAWKDLIRESRLAARERSDEVRQFVGKLSAPPPPPEPTVADVAMPTVKATIANAQVTGLTQADETFLASQLPRYVREATPDERQRFGSPRIVDAAFTELVKDRASLRAAASTAAATSTKTDSFNGGMKRGLKPTAAPAKPAPAPPIRSSRSATTHAPAPRPESSANDIWSNLVEEARQVSL